MTNEETAYRFFLTKGLSDFQSAAIVGNLLQESGLNPAINQQGGGPGRGIAQWTATQRWQNLLAYASQNGLDPYALQTQLNFIWVELNSNTLFGLPQLKASTNVADATRAFQNKFEVCGVCNEPRRIALAQGVLAKYATAATTAPASNDAAQFFFKIVVPLGVAAGLAYYLKDHIGFDRKRARA